MSTEIGSSLVYNEIGSPGYKQKKASPPGWFDVTDFGAKGDGSTDDSEALRETIVAAKQFASAGDSSGLNLSGGVVYLPPGKYRCAARLPVDGPVVLQGATGISTLASSVLVFDENLDVGKLLWFTPNTPTRVSVTSYDRNSIVKNAAADGRSFRCSVAGVTSSSEPASMSTANPGDTVVDGSVTWVCETNTGSAGIYSKGNFAQLKDLAVIQPRTSSRNMLKAVSGILIEAHQVSLHNFTIDNIQGTGLEIAGATGSTNANTWSLSGSNRISRCDQYGVYVHGGDSNAGSQSGILDVSGSKSWGLREASFLGNSWGAVQTAGNGAFHNTLLSAWSNDGGYLPAQYIWSTSKSTAAGDIVVPSFANGATGYWYIATNAGTTHASTEPSWPTTIGATVSDNGVVWRCWIEEGGSLWSEGVNSPKKWGWIYAEGDQNFAQIDSPDTFAGAASSFGWTTTSAPTFGPAFGYLAPFDIRTLRLETWDNAAVQRPLKLTLGERGQPYAGYGRWAGNSNDVSGHFTGGPGMVRDFWDQSLLRWSLQTYLQGYNDPSYYALTAYTICEGRSLPRAGAVCFKALYLGAFDGSELRITATKAQSSSPYGPDFSSVQGSGKGRFVNGDLVWNKPASGRPSVPLAWRANSTGAVGSDNNWAQSFRYPAGITVCDGSAGDPVYIALNYGETGTTKPAFANTPGQQYTDGTITWEWCGTFGGQSHWEPAIATRPLMLTKNVAGGADVTLTTDEAGFDRIKLVGALTGNINVIVEPGAASGWDKVLWNATTGAFTLTIKATAGGSGVAVAQSAAMHVLADSTDAIHVT